MKNSLADPAVFESVGTAHARSYSQRSEGDFEQLNWRRHTALILALLLFVHVGWVVWKSATNMPMIDFLTFWSVSQALSRAPIANVYSVEGQREIASFAVSQAGSPDASNLQRQATASVTRLYGDRVDSTGTPLLYAAIGWLSSGNFATDQKRFVLVCTLCLIFSMLLLKNLLRFSGVEIILLMIFAATYYAPVLADMQVGNINEIQLLAITLFIFLMARARPMLAGAALGAAIMLKPTPIIVLVLAVIAGLADREYRQLLRMLAGSVIAAVTSVLVSAAYFRSPGMWVDFLGSLPRTLNGVSYPLQNGNFSLSALVFGATGSSSAVIPLVLIASFAWLLCTTRKRGATQPTKANGVDAERRMHTAFALGGGGCAIMLLSSTLAWSHYFILLLPLSLYVMRPVRQDSQGALAARVRIIGTLALPFILLMMFSFLAELIVGGSARAICILFLSATVSTLALAGYRIWQQRKMEYLPANVESAG